MEIDEVRGLNFEQPLKFMESISQSWHRLCTDKELSMVGIPFGSLSPTENMKIWEIIVII